MFIVQELNGDVIDVDARSLKSVLVLLPQILGPFGPPKKRVNFDMSIFLSENELLNFSDFSDELSQKFLSNSIGISNFRPLSAFRILFVPKVVRSPKLLLLLSFLVLPNVFGPTTTLAAVVGFQEPGPSPKSPLPGSRFNLVDLPRTNCSCFVCRSGFVDSNSCVSTALLFCLVL